MVLDIFSGFNIGSGAVTPWATGFVPGKERSGEGRIVAEDGNGRTFERRGRREWQFVFAMAPDTGL